MEAPKRDEIRFRTCHALFIPKPKGPVCRASVQGVRVRREYEYLLQTNGVLCVECVAHGREPGCFYHQVDLSWALDGRSMGGAWVANRLGVLLSSWATAAV